MSKIKKTEPIKTILVICLGLIIVYFVFEQRWIVWTSFAIGAIGLSSTFIAQKIDWLWMKLAFVLGLIVPNILLSIIFFLFLTPIAFISKIFRSNNALQLKNNSESLFKESNKAFEASSFEKPW